MSKESTPADLYEAEDKILRNPDPIDQDKLDDRRAQSKKAARRRMIGGRVVAGATALAVTASLAGKAPVPVAHGLSDAKELVAGAAEGFMGIPGEADLEKSQNTAHITVVDQNGDPQQVTVRTPQHAAPEQIPNPVQ